MAKSAPNATKGEKRSAAGLASIAARTDSDDRHRALAVGVCSPAATGQIGSWSEPARVARRPFGDLRASPVLAGCRGRSQGTDCPLPAALAALGLELATD